MAAATAYSGESLKKDRFQGCMPFRLDIRKQFFPQRVFGHWNSSPGQWSQHQLGRVQDLFGQCSQAQDVTPGDGPVRGQELDSVVYEGAFQLSCDSVTMGSLRISTVKKPA